MSERSAGPAPARLVAVLGPTNTGKTHLAVERMLGHASGMIGLPLRLLAREIYDRIVRARGVRSVALITGEEKIIPPRAAYFVCTVEAMPLSREVEFLAIDEIQLCADPERGHVFTHRLLHARGRSETMMLGSLSMAPLIRRLLPDAEIVSRGRDARRLPTERVGTCGCTFGLLRSSGRGRRRCRRRQIAGRRRHGGRRLQDV
jgi:ATP-dependent RNA helicase SUPV3L1/SUV3